MPPLPRNNEPARLLQILRQRPPRRLGGGIHLTLSRPPLGVGPAELNSNRLRALSILSEKQLNPSIGPIQPARSIDPRRQPKPKITLIQPLGIAFRDLQESLDARPL